MKSVQKRFDIFYHDNRDQSIARL